MANELFNLFTPELLRDISLQYKNNTYIGAEVLPIVKVNKPSGRIGRYSENQFYEAVNDLADHRSSVQELEVEYEQVPYATFPHANKVFVSNDEVKLAADGPFKPVEDAIYKATNNLMLNHERLVAQLAFDPANFTTPHKILPATKWSNSASTPVKNIQDAQDATFGNDPLYAAIGLEAFRALQRHPDILAAFHFVAEGAVATKEQIARFFGFADIFVGEARFNFAKKGATADIQRLWGDAMLVYRRPAAPSLMSASFGYTLVFTEREVITAPNPMRGGSTGGTDIKVIFEYEPIILGEPAACLIHDVL